MSTTTNRSKARTEKAAMDGMSDFRGGGSRASPKQVPRQQG
jgi:hypothetical protein